MPQNEKAASDAAFQLKIYKSFLISFIRTTSDIDYLVILSETLKKSLPQASSSFKLFHVQPFRDNNQSE